MMNQNLRFLGQRVREEKTWRRIERILVQPTIKHGGGSIQVWGCISAEGVGDLVRVDGIMTATRYKQILIHHAVPSKFLIPSKPGKNVVVGLTKNIQRTSSVLVIKSQKPVNFFS